MHTCCGEKKEKGNRAPCFFWKFHLTWEKKFFFGIGCEQAVRILGEHFLLSSKEIISQVKMEQNKALKFTSQKQKKPEAKFSGRKKVSKQVGKGSKEIPRLFPPPPPSGECGRFFPSLFWMEYFARWPKARRETRRNRPERVALPIVA